MFVYQSIRIVGLNVSYICVVFITLACLSEKLLPKNCWWHFMTWSDLGDMRRGSLLVSCRFRVSSLPVTRYLRVLGIGFVQKRRLSILFHWFIMERSQNSYYLRSPIAEFRDNYFIDTVMDINRWQFQSHQSVGIAMTSIQTFIWGEVTWRALVTWPWPGSKNFTRCAEDMHE